MPSRELLLEWNRRETGLIDLHRDEAGCQCVPPVALAPEPKGAYVGQDIDDELRAKIYNEGARTIPPRENGGNMDIKNLSRGSRAFLPVFVSGAGLSLGDLHFSQGDGELSFCGAIEMAGITTLKVDLIKNGVEKFAMTMPIFLPSPIDPIYAEKVCPTPLLPRAEICSPSSAQLVFQGISVDLHNGTGKQESMDATLAFKVGRPRGLFT
ncbi:hypothetical protein L7F22_020305 [Adiantum nelumboides]|nr:hypothetical protein [Adiantum nelumboides]